MERPRPSTVVWAGLAAYVAAWDMIAPEGETMSQRLDPILEKPVGRAALYSVVGATALHLLNLIPEKYDAYHYASKVREIYGNSPRP